MHEDQEEGSVEYPQQSEGRRFAISRTIYAETVAVGSPAHREALRLQTERFARVSTQAARSRAGTAYTQTTDYAPEHTVPIVVHGGSSTIPLSGTVPLAGVSRGLLGTARLELPGAMLIEEMIRIAPDSPAGIALRRGHTAEIGAFAGAPGLERAALADVVDAILALIVRLAGDLGIEWLWLFPRNGLMSLLWAEIPGLLPPYGFRRCSDVVGWNESSARLHEFRSLRLKGLGAWPEVFQIRRGELASDNARRLALLPLRRRHRDVIGRRLLGAMCHARHAHAGILEAEEPAWAAFG
jgi:hypothetical protein